MRTEEPPVAEAPIPLGDAVRLCNEIAPKKLKRWWDPSAWQCRGCVRFSRDVEHRCFAAVRGNRGCGIINRRWDAEAR